MVFFYVRFIVAGSMMPEKRLLMLPMPVPKVATLLSRLEHSSKKFKMMLRVDTRVSHPGLE